VPYQRNHTVLVCRSKESALLLGPARREHPVSRAMQRDGRHSDSRLGRQLAFDLLDRRVSGHDAVAMPVRVDDDIDEIRVVEGNGGLLVRRVIEAPVGRPQLPEELAQRAAILSEASAAALGLKIVLVPVPKLILWCLRLERSCNVLNVLAVAASRHEPTHPVGPQRSDDTGRTSSPVVPSEYRARDRQRVHEGTEIMRQRCLLA